MGGDKPAAGRVPGVNDAARQGVGVVSAFIAIGERGAYILQCEQTHKSSYPCISYSCTRAEPEWRFTSSGVKVERSRVRIHRVDFFRHAPCRAGGCAATEGGYPYTSKVVNNFLRIQRLLAFWQAKAVGKPKRCCVLGARQPAAQRPRAEACTWRLRREDRGQRPVRGA